MSASSRCCFDLVKSHPEALGIPLWSCLPVPPPLPLRLSKVPPTQVMRRYHIQDRDDYKKYNKLCGEVTHLVSLLKRLDARDSTRIELTDQLLNKCVAPRPCRVRTTCSSNPCSAMLRYASAVKP